MASRLKNPPPSQPSLTPPKPYHEFRVLAICCLITIATIIGSGILALPVSLYNVSVNVFMLVFTLTLFCQLGVIYVFVELMQRSQQRLVFTAGSNQVIPITNNTSAAAIPSSTRGSPPSQNPADHLLIGESSPRVSLSSIANHYLRSTVLRSIFYFFTFLSFIALLVSYGLAGPQAIWQLIHNGSIAQPPPYLYVIYWSIGTIAVVFFLDILLGVFSSFTVIKGALFISVVIIVATLPQHVRPFSLPSLFSDFSGLRNSGSSFLIGIVALGGLPNTMPVTYALLPRNPTAAQIAKYRASVVLGVILSFLLNIGWVLAVLQVVPRNAPDGVPSLALSYQTGQISTVPLVAILVGNHDVSGSLLNMIEVIIEMFIIVSTAVSFFVISAGMKNFVDGIVDGFVADQQMPQFPSKLMAGVGYILSFGSVLAIITSNPQGFISFMTHFTALSFVFQNGLFLFWMLRNSRHPNSASLIPLEMGPGTVTAWVLYCVPLLVLAAAIAIVGPFIGIKLGGGE
eukprot:GFKZ01008470.1.p1 GENE.GFKZ01008470.1~~GFKZ01008470.1.p1  ORF type:complete len:513 (+),score=45.45 GFKZ01008470.1:291-1829(+)